jgi:hypothetical protein
MIGNDLLKKQIRIARQRVTLMEELRGSTTHINYFAGVFYQLSMTTKIGVMGITCAFLVSFQCVLLGPGLVNAQRVA